MGRGNDLAFKENPEHARALHDMKDQLIIALVKELGGKIDLPVSKIDNTQGLALSFRITPERIFQFIVTDIDADLSGIVVAEVSDEQKKIYWKQEALEKFAFLAVQLIDPRKLDEDSRLLYNSVREIFQK